MDNNEYFASINEVSRRLNVPAHTLRYWEKQFPVAIRPTTGAGGRRYYRADTVERLATIKELLYTRGMTIAGVKKLLREGEFAATADAIATDTMSVQFAPTVATSNIDSATINAVISTLTQARQILSNA